MEFNTASLNEEKVIKYVKSILNYIYKVLLIKLANGYYFFMDHSFVLVFLIYSIGFLEIFFIIDLNVELL